MKAQELRIGNLVYADTPDNIKEIVEIRRNAVTVNYVRTDTNEPHQAMIDYGRLMPVLLTEEWLLRFGFELYFQTSYRGKYSNFRINGIWVYFFCDTNTIEFRDNDLKINHAHQLQNLYYALTGEELTLKQPTL